MSDYRISAVLSLKDQLTGKLSAAVKQVQRIARGVNDFRDKDIMFRVNTRGAEKIQRLRDALKSAGHNLPPINLRVTDNNVTSKITRLRTELQSITGKAHNVTVNVATNGVAALASCTHSSKAVRACQPENDASPSGS